MQPFIPFSLNKECLFGYLFWFVWMKQYTKEMVSTALNGSSFLLYLPFFPPSLSLYLTISLYLSLSFFSFSLSYLSLHLFLYLYLIIYIIIRIECELIDTGNRWTYWWRISTLPTRTMSGDNWQINTFWQIFAQYLKDFLLQYFVTFSFEFLRFDLKRKYIWYWIVQDIWQMYSLNDRGIVLYHNTVCPRSLVHF